MPYRVHHYDGHKKQEDILESILKVIWWLITLPFRLIFNKKKGYASSGGSLDRGFIHNKWQEIEELVRLGQPSNFSRAVLEADKLLDHVLKGYRAPGVTMGDRLKASRSRFTPEGYNAAWKGHKVRNELVHNSQYQLMDYEAKDTINNFKKALEDLINL